MATIRNEFHHQQHGGGWNDDRVAQLKKLWLDGQSANEIARTLGGGLTRNGVIGKVHRLGLPQRGRGQASPPAVRTAPPPRPPRRKAGAPPPPTPAAVRSVGHRVQSPTGPLAPAPLPEETSAPKTARMCTLVELDPHECRWPVGMPDPIQRFCGVRAVENDDGSRTYCAAHKAVSRSASAGPLGRKAQGVKGLERQLRRFI